MYFLFLALVGVSELFADMGINGAVEKRISQGEPVPETVYAALPLKLLLFTLVTATVLYLSPIINPYIGVEGCVPDPRYNSLEEHFRFAKTFVKW